MVNLGLIGAGRWGQRYIETITQVSGARLVGLAHRSVTAYLNPHEECLKTSDWRSLLDKSILDGLIIATPPSTHFEMAISAIDKKIPILIEKPLTLCQEEAREIREYSAKKRVLVMVGHTHIYSEAFRMLKKIGMRLGRLLKVTSSGGSWGPFRDDASMMWDWAPHDLAMCLDLFGCYPNSMTCKTTALYSSFECNGESREIKLAFPNQGEAIITVSNIQRDKTRLFVAEYEGGILIYDDQRPSKLQSRINHQEITKIENIYLPGILPLNYLVSEFSKAISSNIKIDNGVELGLNVVKILEECDLINCQEAYL